MRSEDKGAISEVRCPQCGQSDMVRKVSAIWRGGLMHTGHKTVGVYRYATYEQTVLSELLSPPASPRPRFWKGVAGGLLEIPLVFVFSGLGGLLCFLLWMSVLLAPAFPIQAFGQLIWVPVGVLFMSLTLCKVH